MSDPTDISLARIQRETDNANTRPGDLLKLVAAEMAKEGQTARKIMVMVEFEDEDGAVVPATYRAGCSRYEEAALLLLWQRMHIDAWIR